MVHVNDAARGAAVTAASSTCASPATYVIGIRAGGPFAVHRAPPLIGCSRFGSPEPPKITWQASRMLILGGDDQNPTSMGFFCAFRLTISDAA